MDWMGVGVKGHEEVSRPRTRGGRADGWSRRREKDLLMCKRGGELGISAVASLVQKSSFTNKYK